MLVLAGHPDTMAALLPSGTSPAGWRRGHAVDAATAAVWEALGGGLVPWVLDVPVPPPAGGFWPRLVLLADAPTSPFDVLRGRLAHTVGTAGPLACLALSGHGFHGFRGREWLAAPGNLHLSTAVPLGLPASCAPALIMLPAVAVVDAVMAATRGAIRPGIKWVSDVLVDEGKIAGMLTATQVRGSNIDLAVIGIGLNVTTVTDVVPTPFVAAAGCLRQHAGGADLTPGDMLWHLLAALATQVTRLRAEGPEPLWRDYRRASIVIGRRVRVWDEGAAEGADPARWPPPRGAGLVVDIDRNLGLSLHGRREPIGNGRLAFEEVCQAFGV